MSKGHRICVCGKEHGKQPVIITITKCRHQHHLKGQGSFCISSPPVTSSSRHSMNNLERLQGRSHETEKSLNHLQKEHEEIESKKSPTGTEGKIEKVHYEEKHHAIPATDIHTEYSNRSERLSIQSERKDKIATHAGKLNGIQHDTVTSPEESNELEEVEGRLDEHPHITTIHPGEFFHTVGDEETFDEGGSQKEKLESSIEEEALYNTARQADTSSVHNIEPAEHFEHSASHSSTAYHSAENHEISNEHTDESNAETEPTVMLVTETAVNTMPFLDNLFWSKNRTKSMANMSDDLNDDDCTVELFMFEKHCKHCRLNVKTLKSESTFHDGGSYFRTIGKISFPNCTGDEKDTLAGTFSSESEKNLSKYKHIFKTFENYMRNKQFYETLNKKAPFNLKLHKFITMGEDPSNADPFRSNIDKLYLKKVTTDRSIQLEGFHTRTPRWYDGFLLCFGLKNEEEFYEPRMLNENMIPTHRASSYLVTRYLKI